MEKSLDQFEENIGYEFKNKNLLKTALTHKSYAYENKLESNERLEYLGDSILEFVSSEYLYKNYPNLSEGKMTKTRADAVCEDSLYQVALRYKINEYIYLGKSEVSIHSKKKAILADSVEAIIAAMYLDSNIDEVKKFILNSIKDTIELASKDAGSKDYKSALQERLQSHGQARIRYKIINESGPDHRKVFTAQVEYNGKKLATGTGRSKKIAETEAARKAMEEMDK